MFLACDSMTGVHVYLNGVGHDVLGIAQVCFEAQLEAVCRAHKVEGINSEPLEVFTLVGIR